MAAARCPQRAADRGRFQRDLAVQRHPRSRRAQRPHPAGRRSAPAGHRWPIHLRHERQELQRARDHQLQRADRVGHGLRHADVHQPLSRTHHRFHLGHGPHSARLSYSLAVQPAGDLRHALLRYDLLRPHRADQRRNPLRQRTHRLDLLHRWRQHPGPSDRVHHRARWPHNFGCKPRAQPDRKRRPGRQGRRAADGRLRLCQLADPRSADARCRGPLQSLREKDRRLHRTTRASDRSDIVRPRLR